MKQDTDSNLSTIRTAALLFSLVFICYINSFNVPWQLDDPPNITNNPPLHITDFYPETLWRTFFALPFAEGTLYRPVASLSFALNWYLGQNNPFGYHLVNIFIHFLTTFFLYKSIYQLVRSFPSNKLTEKDIHSIALLGAVLWAVNPIHTQAVTYIVQRMASMAGMFFVIAFYHFISGRLTLARQPRIKHFSLCALFFILALGCKENAVTFIPSLLLLEWIFFQRSSPSPTILRFLVAANLCLFGVAVFYIIDHGYLQSLTTPVGTRPFSLFERLLTEPSILLFYVSLLFYPSAARLSIDHSFPLSTSLFNPWYTFPAILVVLLLIVFFLVRRRKYPLLSFSIIFFFINHSVESSIIPLELVFEHRNYIPSFFLFVPVSTGIIWLLNTFSSSRLLHAVVLTSVPFLIVTLGIATQSRNAVWHSEEALWLDTLSKAQKNARPFAKLGEIYGWQKEKTPKNLQISVALLQKSLDLESPRTSFKAAIMGNIAKVYRNYEMYDLATEYYNKSLQINPDFINSRYDLAETLLLRGSFPEALEQVSIIIDGNNLGSSVFSLKALILLWLDRPKEAVEYNYQAMRRASANKERYFYSTGVALGRAGHYSQGEWFLKRLLSQTPDDARVLCSLIENRLLANDNASAKKYTLQLLDKKGIVTLKEKLEKLQNEHRTVPVDVELISPTIFETAKNAIDKLTTHAPSNAIESLR